MKIQWRKRMRDVVLVFVFSVLFFPATALGAEKGYFENPNEIYARFQDRIYDVEFEVQYAFLKQSATIYSDRRGSSKIGKAAKYTGVIVVSETKSYVQVIYETDSGYGIGWMDRSQYEEIGLLYNGAEKQLLADGSYEMKNVSSGETYQVTLQFVENQQYQIYNSANHTCLDLVEKDGRYQAVPCWAEESDSESQHWQLIREYDAFYLKNKLSGQYLSVATEKGLTLTKSKSEITNLFEATDTPQGTEAMRWQMIRTSGKNVNPYRNFLQYDPDWGSENYGDVDDYSGKIAAAGCGVVAITNAVYALNGQFIDPMLLADYAVEENYRIIGSGTDDGIFQAAAKKFGDAYQFYFVGITYDVFTMRDYLKDGCVAISHVPGHYITVAEYSEKKDKYLVLDSHPIASRPTDPFGNWFPWNRLESGGLASSCYYIYSTDKTLKISTTKETTAEKN